MGIPLGWEQNRDFLVLYFPSAQINNNISAIYCLRGIFAVKFADTKIQGFLGVC